MRRWLARIATWLGTALATLIIGTRVVLDLIGYSTSPEDAEGIPAKLRLVLDFIATQPGILIYGVPALLIVFGAVTLWPHHLEAPTSSKRVPIAVIRKHATKMGWKLDGRSAASSNDSYELCRRLRQSIVDGEQPLWGRLYKRAAGTTPLVHEPMPEHLKSFQINPWSFCLELPQEQTGTVTDGLMERKVDQSYDDLHVDLAKATAWLKRNRKAPDA